MNIVLINPYGPIPIPEENWREYRFTIIGKYLSSLGHDVTWFTSSFSHHFKKQRSKGWKDIEVNEKFKIRLVPTPGYRKNISLGRIFRDLVFSYKVFNYKYDIKPDLIICNESPLSFGYAGCKLGKKEKIPVIFDQMDLWPELMINVFPPRIQKLMNIIFCPVFKSRKENYENLDGFISLARPYMDIPMKIAPKMRLIPHDVIYNGIDVIEFRNNMGKNEDILLKLPRKNKEEIWFTFAGTLGPSYDILNLLDIAKKLIEEKNNKIKFLIAGDGPLRKEVEDYISDKKFDNVYYLGKLRPESLAYLYSKSDVGMSIYTQISNVEMPDKFYDYTAAGLPILNSLKGEVGYIIKEERVGLNYKSGDFSSMYDSILWLANNSDQRYVFSENSKKIGFLFDKNQQIKKLGVIIDEVMKNMNLSRN